MEPGKSRWLTSVSQQVTPELDKLGPCWADGLCHPPKLSWHTGGNLAALLHFVWGSSLPEDLKLAKGGLQRLRQREQVLPNVKNAHGIRQGIRPSFLFFRLAEGNCHQRPMNQLTPKILGLAGPKVQREGHGSMPSIFSLRPPPPGPVAGASHK